MPLGWLGATRQMPIAGHGEASPDGRLDAVQLDAQLHGVGVFEQHGAGAFLLGRWR